MGRGGEGRQDCDTAAGFCWSKESYQDYWLRDLGSGDRVASLGRPALTGLGHPGGTLGKRWNALESNRLNKGRAPIRYPRYSWPRRARTTKEQVSKAQVTQIGLGSRLGKGNCQIRKQSAGLLPRWPTTWPKSSIDLAASSAYGFLGNRGPSNL